MRRVRPSFGLLAIAVGAASLGGCRQGAVWPNAGEGHGRYVGVGIYAPTAEWRQLVSKQLPSSPYAAQRQDDEVILVTADSTTGELRACGDLSAYCVGFNPWKAPLGALQTAPVPVAAHGVSDAPAANTADNEAAAAAGPSR